MFWFLGIRFGPKYLLKMNISVNISDLRPCSLCKKCDLGPYILLKSTLKMQEMPFQRPKIQRFCRIFRKKLCVVTF